MDHFSKPFDKFWLLNTDCSGLFRPDSPTLAQRRYVYKANNRVKGNRPVDVGYDFSTVGLSCRRPRYGMSEAAWNPPLSMRLVPYGVNKNSFTARQVNELLDNDSLPLGGCLTVNTLDSNYSSPEYIAATHDQSNLVNIIRFPSNRNVWKQLSQEEVNQHRAANRDNRGANKVYGAKYKLSEVGHWDLEASEHNSFGVKLSNGKTCVVDISIWEDMLIRSQRGHNMKDKPFRLVRIRLLDGQTMEAVFKNSMWLGVWGDKRKQITAEEIYWSYRNRYDIEHFFRFGKQRLLLDKSQTPDEDHLQNWLEVVNLAYWLLFVGKDEARHVCQKWQQYDPYFKNRVEQDLKVTPSQVQMQLIGIILGFDQRPFLPKVQIKGKGRPVGQTQVKRKRYPILELKKKKKRRRYR